LSFTDAEAPLGTRAPKKRGRKKKELADQVQVRPGPKKRGPKKKAESEKKKRIHPCNQVNLN
jgi:hypothetical protein